MHLNHTPELCKCGCGQVIKRAKYPSWQKSFISGHNVTPKYATLEDRFWAGCIKSEDAECWRWNGNRQRHGYGLMNYRHKDYLAHRVSYMIHFGPIPTGMVVCHKCDNPECTNPNHLFLGTPADNIADMVKKGRQSKDRMRGAKVTVADVLEIRRLYAKGTPPKQLATMFGLSRSGIASIVKRRSWKDIP